MRIDRGCYADDDPRFLIQATIPSAMSGYQRIDNTTDSATGKPKAHGHASAAMIRNIAPIAKKHPGRLWLLTRTLFTFVNWTGGEAWTGGRGGATGASLAGGRGEYGIGPGG